MKTNLDKVAEAILKERYLEHTIFLDDDELEEVLRLIVKKSGKDDWRLVQHRNVEEQEVWYELDLQDG